MLFYHAEWQIRTVVHGDDFVSEGGDTSLRRMDAALKKLFELKTEILGSGKNVVKHLRILNRIITWEAGGIAWEADPRHHEIMIRQLGLVGGKALKLP